MYLLTKKNKQYYSYEIYNKNTILLRVVIYNIIIVSLLMYVSKTYGIKPYILWMWNDLQKKYILPWYHHDFGPIQLIQLARILHVAHLCGARPIQHIYCSLLARYRVAITAIHRIVADAIKPLLTQSHHVYWEYTDKTEECQPIIVKYIRQMYAYIKLSSLDHIHS